MTSPVTTQAAREALAASIKNLDRATTSLRYKTNFLKQHRSSDPLQQMQTDAILDLYDAVREIQQALWPLSIIIPDTEGAREAAGHTTVTATTAKQVNTAFFRR